MPLSYPHTAIAAALVLSTVAATPRIAGAAEGEAAAKPASHAATCGDGLLQPEETCETCAADCTPQSCTPDTKKSARVQITFTAPAESLGGDVRSFTPVATTLAVAYRTNRLQLPGRGTDKAVRARITDLGSSSESVIANDRDHSLRLVVTDTKRLMPQLLTIQFDTCAGAAAPVDDDLTCIVEACAGHGGPLADCYCKATLAAAP